MSSKPLWRNNALAGEFLVRREAETRALAAELAKRLVPGDVVALQGDLGTGKSVFARAILRSLGVKDPALPSPTFALIQEYFGKGCKIAHMDFYRLDDPGELEAIGLRRYLASPWICIIEWAEKAVDLLPPHTHWVYFSWIEGIPTGRKITITRQGS